MYAILALSAAFFRLLFSALVLAIRSRPALKLPLAVLGKHLPSTFRHSLYVRVHSAAPLLRSVFLIILSQISARLMSLAGWAFWRFGYTTSLCALELLAFVNTADYFQMYFGELDTPNLLFAWLVVHSFSYLLFTGVIYFLFRNDSTSLPALARFWQRSFGIFWLLEAFLFLCFAYLTLNQSQELWVAKDTAGLFKVNWQAIGGWIISSAPLLFCILALAATLESLPFLGMVRWQRALITITLYYLGAYELSGLFYALQAMLDFRVQLSDLDSSELLLEGIRLRVVQYYFLLCAVAKFWHMVLVIFAWFYVLPSYIGRRVTQLGVVSFCMHNLIAIFALNLLSFLPYVKYGQSYAFKVLVSLWEVGA